MRLAIVIAAIALAGCAGPRYLTKSCITPAQLEQLKQQAPDTVREKLTGNAQQDVKILAANIIRRRAYEGLLVDSLTLCAG